MRRGISTNKELIENIASGESMVALVIALQTGVGASKFLGVPEFPQTYPKRFLSDFCLQIVHHKNHEDLFFGVTSKTKTFLCFSANVRRHFCPDFQGFCPHFRQIKTFMGALATPSPTPLALHNL